MNMKRARFWRNLLLISAMSGASSMPHAYSQEPGEFYAPSANPGTAVIPQSEGLAPLSPSPYMPLDPGYNYGLPRPPVLPQTYGTLQNSRRDAIGPRFDIGMFLNDRLGVDNGEANFNALVPILTRLMDSDQVLFIDARGVATYAGRGAASAGVGFRYFDSQLNRLHGLSTWIDYDDGHNRAYQQVGVSFESLGTWMDLRVNGYIPFGTETNQISSRPIGSAFFGGNNLLINQQTATESAFRGLDAEIGGPLPILGRYGVSGYVGGYWLTTNTANSHTEETASGPRVRFEANVTDSFRANVTASHDSVFGTNAWVGFQMSLPDGRARQWFRPKSVEDKMLMTVNRSYRVQTHTRQDVNATPLLKVGAPNAKTSTSGGSRPIVVVFVDPDRATNGNGTFEHPFNTLQGFTNLPANCLIVVDGSAAGNQVLSDGNLQLFSDQKLLSTSILAAGGVTLNTNLGVITLPSLANFGDVTPVSPILTSPMGGTLVTLAGNRTEVAGITFDGATGNAAIPNSVGIAGTNIIDFNIHHNAFRNYTDGVVLNNATGVGLFQTNTMTGLVGTSNDGFRLTNSGVGTLDLFVNEFTAPTAVAGAPTPTVALATTGNTIVGNDGAGIRITARNRAEINAHIVGNFIGVDEDTNGNGVLDAGEDLNGDGLLTQGSNGDGIVLNSDATRGIIHGSIVGNIIDGNRGEDRNGNGVLDPDEDTDGDGLLTKGRGVVINANAATVDMATLGEDKNANGKLDPSEDLNGNGVLDQSEDKNNNGILDVSEDTNGNGVLDSGEDTNNNGVLDNAEDINGNGVLDAGEDTNGNGLLDTIEDKNGNGKLDVSEDTNNNGILDQSEDTNGNGRLDGGYLIAGNTITRNTGDGIVINGTNNANINLIITRNNFGNPLDQSQGNGGRGLAILADSGIVNANIGFLSNEDINFNGVLDTEDTDGDGVLDVGEDKNGNGILDTEDTNGNGTLDAANALDGNIFVGNQGGGILVDLSGTAVGNIVALNNSIGSGNGDLTFLINGSTTGVPFSFSNTSQPGINLSNFVWDIQPAGLVFNTLAGDVDAQDFTVTTGLITATGLTSVNGVTSPTLATSTSTIATYAVADQATLLNLQYSKFGSFNGVLDAGEDTNNNGRLDPGEDRPQQFSFGIDVDGVAPVIEQTSGNNFIGSTVTATFSTGSVLSGTLQAVPGNAQAAQFVANAAANPVNAVPGIGIELRASGDAVLNSPTFIGNDVRSQQGGGLLVQATDNAQINNLLIRSNTFQGNGTSVMGMSSGNGVSINTVNAALSTAHIDGSVLGNQFLNNLGAGLSVTADGGTIDLREIDNNTFTGNGTGISLNTINNGIITTRITNNTISNSTGDGIVLRADTGSIELFQFSGNTLSNNGGNAIRFEALNGGTITNLAASEDLNGNGVLDANEDLNGNGLLDLGFFGMTEDLNGNGVLDLSEDTNGNGVLDTEDLDGDGILDVGEDANGNGILDIEDANGNGQLDLAEDVNGNGLLESGNGLFNNATNGLFITGNNGNFNLGTISGLTINHTVSGRGGIVIDTTDSVLTGLFIGNTVFGNPVANANVGPGFSLTATNGTFDVTIGGPNAGDGNTFRGNAGAGIAIVAQNAAAGTFHIEGNTITGTVDDAPVVVPPGAGPVPPPVPGPVVPTPFSGQGIYIGTRSMSVLNPTTAMLTDSVIRNNIIGSASEDTNGNGILDPGEDKNNSGTLDLADPTLANAGGGVLVQVGDQSRLINLAIDGNIIASNGPTAPGTFTANATNVVNGLTILRTGDAVIDNVTITNNRITDNTFDGIYLHALGGLNDVLDFTIQGNTITGNTFDGINLRGEADAFIDATITGNTISNNGFNGIEMTSFVNNALTEQVSLTGIWTKNTIQANGAHGIEISATAGFFGTNQPLVIGQSGLDPSDGLSLGNTITDNGMGGIELNSGGLIEINNNLIARNGATATALGFTDTSGTGGIDFNVGVPGDFQARIIGNVIESNTGDGFELVTSTGQFSALTMLGNSFSANTGRGIDILNRGDGQTALRLGDGTLGGANSILNNGLEGIYIVNTAAAAQLQQTAAGVDILSTDPLALLATGALISDPQMILDMRGNTISGNNNNGLFAGGGLVLRVGTSGSGFVTSRISDNTFSGNLGDDVRFETFASTVAPPAAGPIPLANLNLVFQGNVGDSLDANTNIIPASLLQLEAGFDTSGFLIGTFNTPPWTIVPAGTFSNNSFPNTLFP